MITSTEIQLFTQMKDANYPFAKMNYNFYLKKSDIDKKGLSPIYINVNINGARKRIPVELKVAPEFWNFENKNLKICKENTDLQLILDDIDAKITAAKINFRLNNTAFTIEKFQDVLKNASFENFYAFFDRIILFQKLSKGSIIKHKAIINKMKEFMPNLTFTDFDRMWFDQFRNFLKDIKKNNDTTINSNISVVKKYLYLAENYGVRLNCDLEKIPVGSTKGRIIWLEQFEINKLKEYYFSSYIPNHYKITLGYFLFACYTSLRISDIYERKREEVLKGFIEFYTVKSQKKHLQTLGINETTKKIVLECPELLVERKSEVNLNLQIKKIAKICGITKNLTMHVGRHTFATNYILKNGNVKYLQEILGHSKIETTMAYVHITNREAAMTTFILD